MDNELAKLKNLKPGQLATAAKEYVATRRLRRAFDHVADRVEFIDQLETLKDELTEMQKFLQNEVKAIDAGKFPHDRLEEDVVGKIKSYSVFDWVKLVRKWQE